jgi:hypothetical protein
MKRRTLLGLMLSVVITPWKAFNRSPKRNRVQVFPKPGDALQGLVLSDGRSEVLIGLKVPVEFDWDGETYYNPWQNKWYGHYLTQPAWPILICLDAVDFEGKTSRLTFWKLI